MFVKLVLLGVLTALLVVKADEGDLVKYVDSLDQERTLRVFGDSVVLEKIGENVAKARSGEGLLERGLRYLQNRELRVRMPQEENRSLDFEGRSKKLRRILLPLLLLLKLKAAIVIPAVLSLIALVAFKGLGVSLVALALAGATGLKSVLEGHHGSKWAYEVVPQVATHWNRVGLEPQGYHTIA